LQPLALSGAAVALLAALGIGCTSAPDPDPRVTCRAAFAAARQHHQEPLLQPETAELPPAAAPAPFGESARRTVAPARPRLLLAITEDARDALGSPVEHGFAAACPDVDAAFLALGEREALEVLLVGRADAALCAGRLSPQDQHAGLRGVPFGTELWAVAVASDFPVHSLSREVLRQVLTGELVDWGQLGFDRGPIAVVTPAHQATAARAARALVPGDRFASGALRLGDADLVARQLRVERGAIAVVRVPTSGLGLGTGVRVLAIDGVPPSPAAFAGGAYPYGLPVQLVTAGPVAGVAQRWVGFTGSRDGRELLGRTLALP
jgi:hypothetical protein